MKHLAWIVPAAMLFSCYGYAWYAGGVEGERMAECVVKKEDNLKRYMTDAQVIRRLSISACMTPESSDIALYPISK